MIKGALEERQIRLQMEGHEILRKLNLMKYLSQFGNPQIVGSLALGLMTWPDIDIELVKKINEDEYWKTVQYIFQHPNLKGIFIMDYRKSSNPNTPRGLYIGVQYYGKQKDPWKIDIWFLPPRDINAENFNEQIKGILKDEHRLTILEIKQAVSFHPKYRKEIFSTDIYRAVIQRGVKNTDEFKKYLEDTNRSLD